MVPFVARVTFYATISFVIDFDTALWTGMWHKSDTGDRELIRVRNKLGWGE